MTREEIKNIVRHVFHFYEVNAENCNWTDMNEACGEILKALEQEPTTKNDLAVDCISREQAIEKIKELHKWKGDENQLITILSDLLSVTPTTKENLVDVEDCISRADVLKLMKDNWHTHNGDWAMQESMDDIRALPSVTPIRPKGHWIINKEKSSAKCSNCKFLLKNKDEIKLFGTFVQGYNYCPNCGADMREVKE